MKHFLEGSQAVAEIVALCKPGVISAYPITPQTHIVEGLAQMVADGRLKSQFVNVESEHSAAWVVLGGVAAGCNFTRKTTRNPPTLSSRPIVWPRTHEPSSRLWSVWTDMF